MEYILYTEASDPQEPGHGHLMARASILGDSSDPFYYLNISRVVGKNDITCGISFNNTNEIDVLIRTLNALRQELESAPSLKKTS